MLQKYSETNAVHAAVVRHRLQIGHAAVDERGDQRFRDPAEAESPDRQGSAVSDVRDRFRSGSHYLVHCRRASRFS